MRISTNIRRHGLWAWLTSAAEVHSPGWWARYWWFRLTGLCDCPAPRRDPACVAGWEAERHSSSAHPHT